MVIDITRLLGQYLAGRLPTGVDRVSLAYIAHFGLRARAMVRWQGRSGLFSELVSQEVFAELAFWDTGRRSAMRALVARGVLSSLLRGNGRGAFLLHTGHNDAESPALWRNMCWHRLRPVFFVHDAIPLTHPQFCRAGEAARHARRLDRMLQGAALVANSQATLDQITAYASQKGLGVPPSCVALLAAGSQFAPSSIPKDTPKLIANYPISTSEKSIFFHLNSLSQDEAPYFVVLGTVEPRKNHALMLDVWRSWGDAAAHLVVIGQPGWDTELVQQQLKDSQALGGRVHWVTDADDAQMVRWLQRARALLFPSFVEGFGMPMAEALALGVPVIASDLAVYREFADEVPLYLPPTDANAWLQAVKAYAASGSPERAAQCERILALTLPSWPAHFARVDSLLASLDVAPQSHAVARLQAHCAQLPRAAVFVQGFSRRKQLVLMRYWRAMGLPDGAPPCVWGAPAHSDGAVHVEDGFIRSVGLGADLVAPLSWVFDTRGMYFDAGQPSDLEWLLANHNYTAAQLQRAHSLRQSLVAAGVTKYNLGSPAWRRPALGTEGGVKRHVVLVAGQVETDASIRLGAHAVRTNLQLLQAVRRRCPEAYIVYKPHPDVVAGLRADGSANYTSLQVQQDLANEVIEHGDMAQLLGQVDEVHVITSLTGFEALLRGVPVVVYGAPFYAGWGLTTDVDFPSAVQARRARTLHLDALVAAALIDYPVYLDPKLDVLITPEQALVVLQQQRYAAVQANSLVRWRRPLLALWAKLQGRY